MHPQSTIRVFNTLYARWLKFFFLAIFIIAALLASKIDAETWTKLLAQKEFIKLLLGFGSLMIIFIVLSTLQIHIDTYRLSQTLLNGRIKLKQVDLADISHIQVLDPYPAQAFALGKPKALLMEITTKQYTQIKIPLRLFKDTDSLLATLQAHVPFDKTPVKPQLPSYATRDIGQRVLYILGVFTVLAVGAMVFNHFNLRSLHFGNEPYIYALPLAIIGFLPVYIWVNAEQKAYPLITSIIASLFIAVGGYFTVVQVNRYLTEQSVQIINQPFKLVVADTKHQEWLPINNAPASSQSTDEFHTTISNEKLYIYEKWDGFNAALKEGEIYHIQLQQGLLNDYAFSRQSFHNASPVKEARKP